MRRRGYSHELDRWQRLGRHILSSREDKSEVNKDAHKLSGREYMQCVDCFNGGMARRSARLEEGIPEPSGDAMEICKSSHLFEIRPVVDGRLKDISRASENST